MFITPELFHKSPALNPVEAVGSPDIFTIPSKYVFVIAVFPIVTVFEPLPIALCPITIWFVSQSI